MSQRVVAHFIDHTIVKGTSVDVDPNRPLCHIQTPERQTIEVDLTQVKALYFVKDLEGQPEYDETHVPASGDVRLRGSRQVEIVFGDGEKLGGLMNRYPPNRPFFFVLPMDPASNNIRILVNRDAVAQMQPVDGEPDAVDARKVPPGAPAPRPGLSPLPPRPKRTSWVFDGKDIKSVDVE
jgi:hypothetical protein